jgi:hypothetical protein
MARPALPPEQVYPTAKVAPWLNNLLAWLILLGSGAAIAGSGWVSAQFLANPRSLLWVNHYLPEPLQINVGGWDEPRTLAEIRRTLAPLGLRTGDPLRLGANISSSDLLVPILQERSNCTESCQQIVELRVYRPTQHPFRKSGLSYSEQYFSWVSQVKVEGVEDWFVLEPLMAAKVDTPPAAGSRLGFTQVARLDRLAPDSGVWLTLTGEREPGGQYGQLVHYDPAQANLRLLLPWRSPAQQLPHWEQVISRSAAAELVVDETIGLEPRFEVYEVVGSGTSSRSTTAPVDLRPVTLETPALQDRSYEAGLRLAQSGLWSLALTHLQSLQRAGHLWGSAAAQAQFDLIRYHGKAFAAQANQLSATTRQQVLTLLLDGRWGQAMAIAQAKPMDRTDVLDLLESDEGSLLERMNAALEVSPTDRDLQVWYAALTLVRDGEDRALQWWAKQPQSTQKTQLLRNLAPTLMTPLPQPSPVLPKILPEGESAESKRPGPEVKREDLVPIAH